MELVVNTFKGKESIYIPDAIVGNRIIEIKPFNIVNNTFNTSEYGSYEKLQFKIEAAIRYANDNHMTYEIWTEKSHPWLKTGEIPSN